MPKVALALTASLSLSCVAREKRETCVTPKPQPTTKETQAYIVPAEELVAEDEDDEDAALLAASFFDDERELILS